MKLTITLEDKLSREFVITPDTLHLNDWRDIIEDMINTLLEAKEDEISKHLEEREVLKD